MLFLKVLKPLETQLILVMSTGVACLEAARCSLHRSAFLSSWLQISLDV